MKQFEKMTIGDLRKMTRDYIKMEKELVWVKAKYPKAKEELEDEKFNLNEFIEECN